VAARTSWNLKSGAAAATFSVFLHRGRARPRCATLSLRPCHPPLSFSPFPSGLSGCPSLSFPPLGQRLPLPPFSCVYQVIGCEMKSNENPFRRVHSRSTVGRVAQPRPRLAPPSLSLSLSLLSLSPFRSRYSHGCAFPPGSPLPGRQWTSCVYRDRR